MFKLTSSYALAGDQPQAVQQLLEGLREQQAYQTLLGVTGSGKTFTIANVIQQMQVPTLIITHNKTLVAQLYGEFKQFFPENKVGYFVSYYDYYQPEAYLPSSDTYIEKDLSINDKIDELRLQATTQLLGGHRDVIIVASVSCIYGLGNPQDFAQGVINIEKGQVLGRQVFINKLLASLYKRSHVEFNRGEFIVNGDTIDINLPYADFAYRIIFEDNKIESISSIHKATGKKKYTLDNAAIFPANLYIASKDVLAQILVEIEVELQEQLTYFNSNGRYIEEVRLRDRVNYDMQMIKELGYCSGIENYSRFFDRRPIGTRPYCLLDYMPSDFLCVIDESHQTIPQIRGMYAGDRSRKLTLVNYGFRLPSALDNRPLNFDEFSTLLSKTIFISATPSEYELQASSGVIVEQIVRPTGLLDPPIEVRPTVHQVKDLLQEIEKRVALNERTLVITLTKRMAEELQKYFEKHMIASCYVHGDVDTLDRIEIIRKLRMGTIDVLIGVNLLREGLDLPEVSLVAILDADKEGFLRNFRSLTQTAGRAARNANGLVILYGDSITQSMQQTIDETNKRRTKQMAYNAQHGIIPQTILKSHDEILKQTSLLHIIQLDDENSKNLHSKSVKKHIEKIDIKKVLGAQQQETDEIKQLKKKMKEAAKKQDFMEAAYLRDLITEKLSK